MNTIKSVNTSYSTNNSCESISDILAFATKTKISTSLLKVFDGEGKGKNEEIMSFIEKELTNDSDTNFLDECFFNQTLVKKLKNHYSDNQLVVRLLNNDNLVWINEILNLDMNKSLLKNYIIADKVTQSNIELLFTLKRMGTFGEKGFPENDAPAFDVNNKFCVIRKDEKNKYYKVFVSKGIYPGSNAINYGVTTLGIEGVLKNEFKIQTYDLKCYGAENSGIFRIHGLKETLCKYEEVYHQEKCDYINEFGFNEDPNEALLHFENDRGVVRRFEDTTYRTVIGNQGNASFSKNGYKGVDENELFGFKSPAYTFDDYRYTIFTKHEHGYNKLFEYESVDDCFDKHFKGRGKEGLEKNETFLESFRCGKMSNLQILRKCTDGTYKISLDLSTMHNFCGGFSYVIESGENGKYITMSWEATEEFKVPKRRIKIILNSEEKYIIEK